MLESQAWAEQADIARRFGRAAAAYDEAATIQRLAGARLCAWASPPSHGRLLDVGSGSGWWSAHWQAAGAKVYALDLSPAMLAHARGLGRGDAWLAADACHLPLAAGSMDMVFSNLALQWCADWRAAWAEIWRVLRPGASALVSTLAEGSMQPLRQAWAAVDGRPHSLQFAPEAELAAAVAAWPWADCCVQAVSETLYFPDLASLLYSVRGVGATHVAGRTRGLTGKRQWQGFATAYQAHADTAGRLPLNYRLLYCRVQKAA